MLNPSLCATSSSATATEIDGWVQWVNRSPLDNEDGNDWSLAYHPIRGHRLPELLRYEIDREIPTAFVVQENGTQDWYVIVWDYLRYDTIHVLAGPIDNLEAAKTAAELLYGTEPND